MATRSKEVRKAGAATWSGQVRRILLAAVGAVVLAQEEIEDFIERLVKRGEMAEQDGKKLLDDILARRRKQVQKVGKGVAQLGTEVQSRIEDALHRVKLVSKRDVDNLSSKLEDLTDTVDKLAQGRH
ncbi:MAG: phasin family protein [Candidatus Riflebacteria bacterium]|nr:phasin family protein [Candidatus Riflebacteria bacterium]